MIEKSNVYFYPNSLNTDGLVPNPYVKNLRNALLQNFNIINLNKPSGNGIIDILKYVSRIDYVYLNWIEDIPDKRGGVIQFILFVLLIPFFKIKKVKIIWTLHNKESHYHTNLLQKKILMNLLIKHADFILTHSSEGLRFLKNNGRSNNKKSIYLPHPVMAKDIVSEINKEYDIFIWGSIKDYKGIDKFLTFLYQKNIEKKYRILVAGKVSPKSYKVILDAFVNEKIKLIDDFINDEQVAEFASKSKIILFPYLERSVLSSGALMDSLTFGAQIIGPETGAFSDLAKEGIIESYTDYEDLVKKIDKCLNKNFSNDAFLKKFLTDNSWRNFSNKLLIWFRENKKQQYGRQIV